VPTSRVSTDEDFSNVTTTAAEVGRHPLDRINAIIECIRKEVLRSQSIPRRDKRDARRSERRGHKSKPLLVAGRPAAPVPEQQDASVRIFRIEYQQPLVIVSTKRMLGADNSGTTPPAFDAVGGASLGQRFLRRIVHLPHRCSSIAASTRSGVIGSIRTRAPVAWRMALAMAGAAPTNDGSPIPFAPTGWVGSGSSRMIG